MAHVSALLQRRVDGAVARAAGRSAEASREKFQAVEEGGVMLERRKHEAEIEVDTEARDIELDTRAARRGLKGPRAARCTTRRSR